MNPLVMKFGGSSLASPERRNQVCQLISQQEKPVLVVVSAQGDTTDELLRAAHLAGEGKQNEAARVAEKALQELGCEWLQGYYYGRPMPGQDFLEKFKPQDINE